VHLLDQQFAELSALLFPADKQARLTTGRRATANLPTETVSSQSTSA